MNLFSSEKEIEEYKNQLIHYFALKKDQDVLTILKHAKLEFVWYSHDNWNGGFDIYELDLKIPIEIYVKLEDKLNDLASKINLGANKLIQGNDEIASTSVVIEQSGISQQPDQDLLMIVEKVKTILIAKATGQSPDEEEFKGWRKFLLDRQDLKAFIPSFIKYYSNLAEFWIYIKPKFPTYASRREHIIEEFRSLINFVNGLNCNPMHINTENGLTKLNSESVHKLWAKALARLNGDPEGAITAANTLLEDTIKSILNDLKVEYSDEKDDLPKLYKLLADSLNLSPSQHIEAIFKQILGGCYSIVLGLGSLRNKIGDAHARGKRPVKPAARHAQLAVNLAGTMALFLIETWENKNFKENQEKV